MVSNRSSKTAEEQDLGVSNVSTHGGIVPPDSNPHQNRDHVVTMNNENNVPDDDIDALLQTLKDESGEKDEEDEEVEKQDDLQTGIKKVPPQMLNTDPNLGLTNTEARERLGKFGANILSEHKENMFIKFLMYFWGPIQVTMIGAAVLGGALRDWVDLGVICALLLLNACVGFLQEYQASNIVAQLKSQLAAKASVKRDGRMIEIDAKSVVPGDIVHVEEGSIVPADGRVVSEHEFIQVDQSSLTGESLAVEKQHGDDVFSSSLIKRGQALIIVTGTGDNTYVGKSAKLSASTNTRGHFTEVLNNLGIMLLILVILSVFIAFIGGFFYGKDVVTILTYALVIMIIGVPVGLPAVVTTTLAVGAAYLARKKAIVQKLSAIESLAGVTVLCSDKTGTLTKNKLSLTEPYTVEGVETQDLILCCALASSRKIKGLDPIDKCVLLALLDYSDVKERMKEYTVLEFRPFDPVRKRVGAVVEGRDGKKLTCIKGAPQTILELVVQRNPALPQDVSIKYEEEVAEFARRGFRSLGAAWQKEGSDWQILGILPIYDPPRIDTATTIQDAKGLGLQVKMLTGDAVAISKELARQLNLGSNIYDTKRLVGGDGGKLTGSELGDFVVAADGFAQVFPEHKYQVVDILQRRGLLVAMTGDGVNDAPSLKKADCGIAVSGASDAARSAADIVFLAPGLGTIIDAVKTSRQIFHRMLAYVQYRIALSLHLEIFLVTSILIVQTYINPELIVFLAIFADVATLAIAYDNAPFSMDPVEWNLPKIWMMALILGVELAAFTWLLYGILLSGVSGFLTASETLFKTMLPSWQLAGAVFVVDIIATVFTVFGWWGSPQSASSIVGVWLYSIGVFVVLAATHGLINTSRWVNSLGKKEPSELRSFEDFLFQLQSVSRSHEKGFRKPRRKDSTMHSPRSPSLAKPKRETPPTQIEAQRNDVEDGEADVEGESSDGYETEREGIAKEQRRRESNATLRRRNSTIYSKEG
ncbi:H+-exporting ATPase [Synchytrium endobioticum]|uniref:Plasma membrane ATPase n=1 Tax=Synchytrium endobioticum TaxID=286115 RepID=A0A507D674_9FUNG|nr:H+-exporting ATPase [Synchytrium endobioticum]